MHLRRPRLDEQVKVVAQDVELDDGGVCAPGGAHRLANQRDGAASRSEGTSARMRKVTCCGKRGANDGRAG
jgi:hypothetical protein